MYIPKLVSQSLNHLSTLKIILNISLTILCTTCNDMYNNQPSSVISTSCTIAVPFSINSTDVTLMSAPCASKYAVICSLVKVDDRELTRSESWVSWLSISVSKIKHNIIISSCVHKPSPIILVTLYHILNNRMYDDDRITGVYPGFVCGGFSLVHVPKSSKPHPQV